jgi:hypothetical protein
MKDALAVLKVLSPALCQLNPPGAPVEKAKAQITLEIGDAT